MGQELPEKARSLHQQGLPIHVIARNLELSLSNISKYL
jgi:orotate phosphoribosyltransferase-like protein